MGSHSSILAICLKNSLLVYQIYLIFIQIIFLVDLRIGIFGKKNWIFRSHCQRGILIHRIGIQILSRSVEIQIIELKVIGHVGYGLLSSNNLAHWVHLKAFVRVDPQTFFPILNLKYLLSNSKNCIFILSFLLLDHRYKWVIVTIYIL